MVYVKTYETVSKFVNLKLWRKKCGLFLGHGV